MLRVRIDGLAHEFREGTTILDAARAVGARVPTLCDDERLRPRGLCRLCLVEVKGRPHPCTACNTPLEEGMEVTTGGPRLERARRMILKILARDYPSDELHRLPDKRLHRYLREYGFEDEMCGVADVDLVDDSHPYIHVDMSRCIDCRRCARICEEVQGQFVWRVFNRGKAQRILPSSLKSLLESPCVSCGACSDTCPTGALADKSVLAFGEPNEWTKTTCPYCGTGCELNVGRRDGRIVQILPVFDAPVSRGHLCVKGRYAFDFVRSADRVTEPMIRRGGVWERVSWAEAVAFAAEGLRRVVERHGPDSVGVLGSARATNEENYLTQKFARVALGTNNVDCCARVCHTPTAAAMKLMLGTGAATNSFDDIERARAILVCGANPTESHPVVGARIKQAALRGAKLVVIDPRGIELARYAGQHLALRPGTNVPLLNAMAYTIIEEKLYDEEFMRERVNGLEEFREFIRTYSPEAVAATCGVEANVIRETARVYATAKPAMCFHGLGVTEHTQGTEGVMCLVNLALLTGNLGQPGSGINPLRGQNNVQGAAHMGCDPGTLTGSVPLAEGKDSFERVWRAPVPMQRGMNLLEMMDAAGRGNLRALWAIGYDILLTNADAHATERALRSLDLLVVQDLFMSETAKEFGTVFFPAASSFEKDGTFMNAERRVQRVRKAVEPPGHSKPDWEIICLLARAMGKGDLFGYASPEEVWEEVRAVWPQGRGITYGRIERGGLQWPCPAEDHPGTQVIHTESFPMGQRAALRRVPFRPTPETTDGEYPFLLITGRTLYPFNAGTMTMRTPNASLRPADTLDMHPDDARRLALRKGERVRVRSRYGEAVLPINLTNAVKRGELFATFHTPEVFLNRVTGPRRDRFVKAPEYKVTAVRIEKLTPPSQHVNEQREGVTPPLPEAARAAASSFSSSTRAARPAR
ncbi:MAG TPA: formate dehydrogenase subunit alpha [Pyrinomonadaceae bacterium]